MGYTKQDIENKVSAINNIMAEKGSAYRIGRSGRYGKQFIELCRKEDYDKNGYMIGTTGHVTQWQTKKEAYDTLQAIQIVLDRL